MAATMTARAVVHAMSTSVLAGERLEFRLLDERGAPLVDEMTVEHGVTGTVLLKTGVVGRVWGLAVPSTWSSGLYRAVFSRAGEEVWFVVRPKRPGSTSSIVVSIPFLTWQAYNRAGVPGQSIYWNEQPDRAARISFDRSGGGPAPEQWEHPMLGWLVREGPPVEYCSSIDFHRDPAMFDAYRLVVIVGHDEYWTREMRDAVETFVRRGGNAAFFSGNTSWWQARLADGERTMVCYRDAAADPMTAIDPERTTVEWSSAPVLRPENAMTGVSFRRGAGNWIDYPLMERESYTVRFAGHWVFEGTGLTDGDRFAAGSLGYETDAADIEERDGIPYATGRDGTPGTFTVLATADLRHWRKFGQGGMATMGAFRLGRGRVFNAATINWGRALGQPVADRITRNVLDRLSRPDEPGRWDDIGTAASACSLVACEGSLFSTDQAGLLRFRPTGPQNFQWRAVDIEPLRMRCLTAPREATGGMPLGLYGVSTTDILWYRDGDTGPAPWQRLAAAPDGVCALAACDLGLFAVAGDRLWHSRFDAIGAWQTIDEAPGVVAMGGTNGRIFAITDDDRLLLRLPITQAVGWVDAGPAEPCVALTAYAGLLIAVDRRDRLLERDIPTPTEGSNGS
jgi:hypothetical protein